jgi:hypothetical protein
MFLSLQTAYVCYFGLCVILDTSHDLFCFFLMFSKGEKQDKVEMHIFRGSLSLKTPLRQKRPMRALFLAFKSA